jgi:HEPN domain-containing protein
MAAQYEPNWLPLRERVKQLDFYYVEARYPKALEDVIPAEFFRDKDASEAIAMATLAVDAARQRIS